MLHFGFHLGLYCHLLLLSFEKQWFLTHLMSMMQSQQETSCLHPLWWGRDLSTSVKDVLEEVQEVPSCETAYHPRGFFLFPLSCVGCRKSASLHFSLSCWTEQLPKSDASLFPFSLFQRPSHTSVLLLLPWWQNECWFGKSIQLSHPV